MHTEARNHLFKHLATTIQLKSPSAESGTVSVPNTMTGLNLIFKGTGGNKISFRNSIGNGTYSRTDFTCSK